MPGRTFEDLEAESQALGRIAPSDSPSDVAATINDMQDRIQKLTDESLRDQARKAVGQAAPEGEKGPINPTEGASTLIEDLEMISRGAYDVAACIRVRDRFVALEEEVARLHARLDDKALEGELD